MRTSHLSWMYLASGLLVMASSPWPAACGTPDAPIVFSGNVTKIAATTMPAAPASPKTLVVQVTTVARKPQSVLLRPGDLVTVEVLDPAKFKVGTPSVFYTEAWVFGEGIAVKEVGYGPPQIAPAGGAATSGSSLATSDAMVREDVLSAELIVVGRVLSIKPSAQALASSATPQRHISEHEPNWQDAVVRVESTVKGKTGTQVVVRFPASWDIAWASAPKLKAGQTATFLLNPDQVSGTSMAMVKGLEVHAYTALRAGDVLPAAEAPHVRAMMNQ